jgi:hypothetical protein
MAYYGNITLTAPSSTWSTIAASSLTGTSYTLGTSTGTWADDTSSTVVINRQGITLQEEADLVLGGRSVKTMLAAIESKLAILSPNHKLEEEWEELKRLGDAYRSLEKEIQEKAKTWDILKK